MELSNIKKIEWDALMLISIEKKIYQKDKPLLAINYRRQKKEEIPRRLKENKALIQAF